MNIAICDDSDTDIDEIEKHLRLYFCTNGINLNVFKFNNGNDILNQNISFDMVFLDVEIEKENGLEIGKKLKAKYEHLIIFVVTAYDKYLDGAFDLSAFRFLSKPLNIQRLYTSLDSAVELLNDSYITFIESKNSNRIKLHLNDIILVEVDNRLTKIISTQGVFYSKNKISYWKEKLNASFYAIPHFSYIINMNYTTSHKRNEVTLTYKDDDYNVPISAPNQSAFRKKYFKFQGNSF